MTKFVGMAQANMQVQEGVLFLTYSSLISSAESGHSRLQQIVDWCGVTYDGLLIFDECHKVVFCLYD